jgi:hypothetical protein
VTVITLAIPTRSRAIYLRETLRTVATAIAQCPVPVEVVVSDNASEDETAEVCAAAGLPELVHLRQPLRLSMRQNFEAALAAATGSHVVFIGDDDAVAPHGLRLLAEMIASGDHDILKWRVVNYIWPDLARNNAGGVILRPTKLSGGVRRIDPKALLAEFTSGRFGTYQSGAMIYHGCISRRLIDRVRAAQGGTYFWTTCPDVYASVTNLLHCQTDILAADIPVTIGGASPRSNGTSGKEYSKTAQTDATSEYARFLAELQGDAFLGRTPATCASINLVTIDALQLSHAKAGLPLVLNSRAWIGRISSELTGLAPAVAAEAKAQAVLLLGDDAAAITLPEPILRAPKTEAAFAEAAPGPGKISVSLAKVRISGGAMMQDVVSASGLIDQICGGGTRFADLPRGKGGVLWRIVGLLRRARAARGGPL